MDTFESIKDTINKKHGANTIIKASEMRQELPRITTGVLAFDLMLGGGWPVNQWSEIIGDELLRPTLWNRRTTSLLRR